MFHKHKSLVRIDTKVIKLMIITVIFVDKLL